VAFSTALALARASDVAGAAGEASTGDADVLQEAFNRCPSPHGACDLRNQRDAAEVATGVQFCRLSRLARVRSKLGGLLEVKANLVGEIAFTPGAAE